MKNPGWQSFIELCLKANAQEEYEGIFDLLFTPEEKSDMALRCLILKELLSAQKTQREMAKDLKVSIAKITRGSNELKRIPPKTKKFLLKNLI
jgi:TrpR family trp operon transcriptional repressor